MKKRATKRLTATEQLEKTLREIRASHARRAKEDAETAAKIAHIRTLISEIEAFRVARRVAR
jgi:hypothetical protein